jgi:hypothetical protein
MKKRTVYIQFLITGFLTIRTLTGWGSELKPPPYPILLKQSVPALVYCINDTVPPKKTEQDKNKKNDATVQDPAKVPENNVTATVPKEIKVIKEVPKSKKKIKPVKIDGLPPPKNIIKPKIVIKKIKI